MKKLIILLIVVSGLIVVGLAALDSGWVLVPEWYKNTNRYRSRSLQGALQGIARAYEEMEIPPPTDSVQILEDLSDRWGTPVQYSYEKGEPILRAAGKDGELHTKDDITQKVRITTGLS